MKYKFLLLFYSMLLRAMDQAEPPINRASSKLKNLHLPEDLDQNPAIIRARGKLIESYRQGGRERLIEKTDKLSQILQEHGIKANAIVKILDKIQHNKFEIFSPRNNELERILQEEAVHSDAVSEVVKQVKSDDVVEIQVD